MLQYYLRYSFVAKVFSIVPVCVHKRTLKVYYLAHDLVIFNSYKKPQSHLFYELC